MSGQSLGPVAVSLRPAHCRSRARWPIHSSLVPHYSSLFRDHPVEQLLQVLVVTLKASEEDAVVIGEGEEGARDPTGRHSDAQLATAIVVDDPSAFKLQLLHERCRVALDL